MQDAELGRSLQLLRHRRGWRQKDVSERTGLSRSIVSMVERGRASELTVRTVRKLAEALGAPLGWDLAWRKPELEQLRDAAHAALQNDFKLFLERLGWSVHAEVSFSHYGDRGRVARRIASELGWRPAHVVPAIVIAEASPGRRRVRHTAHYSRAMRCAARGRSPGCGSPRRAGRHPALHEPVRFQPCRR